MMYPWHLNSSFGILFPSTQLTIFSLWLFTHLLTELLASLYALALPHQPESSLLEPVSWPLPHNVTGESGGWGGIHVHDPSIIYNDGYYYSFSTHDLVAIGRSRTLSGYWSRAGSVLSGASIIDLPGRNDTWGPDVQKVGDTFYLYYSVSTFGSQTSAIGLATSKTLDTGTWTDHGQVFASSADAGVVPFNITNAIDPNLFIDSRTGDAIMTYGSFYGDLWQIPLSKNLSSVLDKEAARQVSIDPLGTRPEEGSYLSSHDGWYYLWFSHGICCGYAQTLPAPGTEYEIPFLGQQLLTVNCPHHEYHCICNVFLLVVAIIFIRVRRAVHLRFLPLVRKNLEPRTAGYFL